MKYSKYWMMGFISVTLAFSAAANDSDSSPRERLLMDFNWRFTLGDPADALVARVPASVTNRAVKDLSGDNGVGGAELTNKSGDVAKQTGIESVFDYPEPGALDKTKVNDREERAKLDVHRPDPVALNLGGNISYVQPSFDDSNWRKLDLPHDWVVELPFGEGDCAAANIAHGKKAMDSKLGNNIGWYRREFNVPEAEKGKILWVEFDGVYRNCLVWFNGHCLGRHLSGYTSFYYDITKFVNFGGHNTFVVRVDATRGEGWFYEGGGIYRHVWLVKTSPIHVAHWGTFVTNNIIGKNAEVTFQTEVQNDLTEAAASELISTILDANGKIVAKTEPLSVALNSGETKTVLQTLTIKNAKLWSPESPTLYRVVSTVKNSGTVADVYETPFGIRTIHFDPDKGFFLNGKRVEIKGMCGHQDFAGVGVALPDRMQEFRIEKLKEMGCNAYRCAHNPPASELLDDCDRFGMLVLDENRRFDNTPEVLGELRSMIRRDRNHPSIFLWSLANEEMDLQKSETIGVQIARDMQNCANKLDPTRLCTIANNGAWKGWRMGFNNIIEVDGCNYFSHEEKDLDKWHADFPGRLVIGTEEASTLMTHGKYARDNQKGFMPAYDTDYPKWGATAEQWWSYYASRTWLPGGFAWTGFDYRGEPTPFNFAYSSQFGQMDICGFPKDSFYYYQAWWTEKPVLHVFPHWNWSGCEGQDINVWAFGNCQEVELFLNGQSLGRKTMKPDSHLEWQVKYVPGTLLARGYKDGKQIAEDKVETTGAPAAVKLTPDRTVIRADGQDVSLITLSVVDAQGRVVPTADNEIHFSIEGAGRIIGVGNGNPNTIESDKLPQRKAFNGLALVTVQSKMRAGEIRLMATADHLTPATTELQAKGKSIATILP